MTWRPIATLDASDGISLVGTSGDDVLVATSTSEILDGGSGFDVVSYKDAAAGVTIALGVSDYQLIQSMGFEKLISIEGLSGSAFGDTFDAIGAPGEGDFWLLDAAGGNDYIFALSSTVSCHILGGDGMDTLDGGAYGDELDGGIGSDRLYGWGGADLVHGGEGDDYIDTGLGADTAYGGDGADMLISSGPDANLLYGEAGDDTMKCGQGRDTLDGGDGSDVVSYLLVDSGVVVSLTLSGPQDTRGAGIQTLVNVEAFIGSNYDDLLYASDNGSSLDGGGGGSDTLVSGAGDDTLKGATQFYYGAASDTASYERATAAVTVDLGIFSPQDTGGAGTDSLALISNLIGSSFDDHLALSDPGELQGAAGDDTLVASDSDDTLGGGSGVDVVSYERATEMVHITLGLAGAQDTVSMGNDTLTSIEGAIGSAQGDVLAATGTPDEGGVWYLYGAGGDDVLTGASAASNSLSGGEGKDSLAGGLMADALDGDDGNDSLSGGGGADIIHGGTGADLINTGAGADTAYGGGDSDFLIAGGDGAELHGEEGDDNLSSGQGGDTLDGGTGDDIADYHNATVGVTVSLAIAVAQDTGAGMDLLIGIEEIDGSQYGDLLTVDETGGSIKGAAGDDTLIGGAGGDVIAGDEGVDTASYALAAAGVTVDLNLSGQQDTGGAGTDLLVGIERLIGSDFDDLLTLGAGGGFLDGGGGDDLLVSHVGAASLSGGAGVDTVSYAGGAAVRIDLSQLSAQDTGGAGTQALIGIERLIGSDGDDTLSGGAYSVTLDGGQGGDMLSAGAGASVLDGGEGDDELLGGAHGDVLTSGTGTNHIEGGGGADTLSYALSTSGMVVNLAEGEAHSRSGDTWDTFASIERLTGSDFADSVHLEGGVVTIAGGAGDDVVSIVDGRARIEGGDGLDTIDFSGAEDSVVVKLSSHQQDTHAGVLTMISIEQLIGSAFDDRMVGSGLADYLIGADGNDRISAKAGADLLEGGGADDVLTGGAGADTLVGGKGADIVTGGQNADLFLFRDLAESAPEAVDLIRDLSTEDVIDISAIDARTDKAGNQAFELVDGLTGHAGQAALVVDAKHHVTLLELDIDGDARSDMTVRINGLHGDFANLVL